MATAMSGPHTKWGVWCPKQVLLLLSGHSSLFLWVPWALAVCPRRVCSSIGLMGFLWLLCRPLQASFHWGRLGAQDLPCDFGSANSTHATAMITAAFETQFSALCCMSLLSGPQTYPSSPTVPFVLWAELCPPAPQNVTVWRWDLYRGD